MFGKESELDKMVDSYSMAGPFALIPSQNVFKSQACTPDRGATMRMSILEHLISWILYGGVTCYLLLPDESTWQLDLLLKMVSYVSSASLIE